MKNQIYAGIGLGLLTGVIIGLSIAQVTGIILGALTSLLVTFFGLNEKQDSATSGNGIIIGTFSITCVAAIFTGMYIRTHSLLTPTLANEIKSYQSTHLFSQSDIKNILLVKELGLIPKDATFSKDARSVTESGALMSGGDSTIFLCTAISNKSSLQEIKRAFDNSGGKYAEIEQKITQSISDSTQLRNTLLVLKDVLCK